jgi:hypothetical protein
MMSPKLQRLWILGNVPIIASVVFTAILLFKMVASMYNPLSVKAFGVHLFPFHLEVDIFDLKFKDSSSVISSKYPSMNQSGLFLTASLIRLVSRPYTSTTSASIKTCSSRVVMILSSIYPNLTISILFGNM